MAKNSHNLDVGSGSGSTLMQAAALYRVSGWPSSYLASQSADNDLIGAPTLVVPDHHCSYACSHVVFEDDLPSVRLSDLRLQQTLTEQIL